MIALAGNLARDLVAGGPPRTGGGAFHGARALSLAGARARVYARCADADRAELAPPLERLGVPVELLPGRATAAFEHAYEGDERRTRLVALGDPWLPEELPALPAEVTWVHASPLARSDFPAATLAELARGRRLSLDGQGLVRAPRPGPLALDADYDPELLRHVAALKLADEEAEVLGDPAALPVAEVLVTHGSRGVTVYAGGRAEEVAARPVDADPTGAGDAFCAGYVAARAEGLPPVEAARRAVALVARVLEQGVPA